MKIILLETSCANYAQNEKERNVVLGVRIHNEKKMTLNSETGEKTTNGYIEHSLVGTLFCRLGDICYQSDDFHIGSLEKIEQIRDMFSEFLEEKTNPSI